MCACNVFFNIVYIMIYVYSYCEYMRSHDMLCTYVTYKISTMPWYVDHNYYVVNDKDYYHITG